MEAIFPLGNLDQPHDQIRVAKWSSIGETPHTCNLCHEPVEHDDYAFVHHVIGSDRFRGSLFVAHWDGCAEKAGLR